MMSKMIGRRFQMAETSRRLTRRATINLQMLCNHFLRGCARRCGMQLKLCARCRLMPNNDNSTLVVTIASRQRNVSFWTTPCMLLRRNEEGGEVPPARIHSTNFWYEVSGGTCYTSWTPMIKRHKICP